jgi:glutamate/tyrosine decarboxylase-like PLP-dependent enzyme
VALGQGGWRSSHRTTARVTTFCQTWEEPEVLGLMALSINKNMIDKHPVTVSMTKEESSGFSHLKRTRWATGPA